MKNKDAYAYGWQAADRNDDNTRIYDSVVDRVVESMNFDVAKEKRGKAKRIIAARMRPGTTAAEGAVVLPGMEPYAYEPHRLVADNEGNVAENRDASPKFKDAEANRAEDAARRADMRADRERREADHFSEWAEREAAKGRDQHEITWDTCVRETGLWKDADVEPVEDDEPDDEVSA